MATMLGLTRSGRRTGDDATDEKGRAYELKSTTKGSVGTSRDVGESYLDRMLSRALVVLKGRNTVLGYDRQALVVVPPAEMRPWVDELRSKIRYDVSLVERAIAVSGDAFDHEAQDRLRYIGKRGATRNNPKVPWRYVVEAGIFLREGQEAEDLAAVMDACDQGADLAAMRALVGDNRPTRDLRAVAQAELSE